MKKFLITIIIAITMSMFSVEGKRTMPQPAPVILIASNIPDYGLRRRPMKRFYPLNI